MDADFRLQKKFSSEIKAICEPIFDLFKITYFSHTRAVAGCLFIRLTTEPEVMKFFLDNKYPISFTDGKGYFLNNGFYIANHVERTLHSKEKLVQFRDQFNIDHIVYFIEKCKRYEDLYVFGTNPQNSEIINCYINNMHFLRQFILYYKEKSAPILNKIQLVKYDETYICVKNNSYSLPDNHTFNTERFMEETRVKKMKMIGKFGQVNISQRELACLKYLLKNHTQKEIAKIMMLSPRTVETYINNLKNKFGYTTQRELIFLAEKMDLRFLG